MANIFVFCDRYIVREGRKALGHRGRVPICDFKSDQERWGLREPSSPIPGSTSGAMIHPIRKTTMTCSRCGLSVRAEEGKLATVLDDLAARGKSDASLTEIAAMLRSIDA